MVSKKQLFFKLTLGLNMTTAFQKLQKKIFPSLPVAVFSPPALAETNIFFSLPYSSFAKLKQIIAGTYPGRLGARCTGLGCQTLAPKKDFLTFYLKIFFKHPRRRVFRFSIYVI